MMPRTKLPTDEDLGPEEDTEDVEPKDEGFEDDASGSADDVDEDDADRSQDDEALEELEAEELEMLTEDEAAEALVVNEAAEMAAIRRAELALANSGEQRSADEFLCQNCFLLKRPSQLADKRRQLCNDCA